MVDVIPDNTDYSEYAKKEFSPIMSEFIDWLRVQFPDVKIDERSAYLGIRMYGFFQKSESHQSVIDAKRRGAESPVRPAKRGRPAGAPAKPYKPARAAAKVPAKAATAKAAPAKAALPKAAPAAKATKPAARAASGRAVAKPVARPGKRGAGVAPY